MDTWTAEGMGRLGQTGGIALMYLDCASLVIDGEWEAAL